MLKVMMTGFVSQANKNTLVKGMVGTGGISAAVALKAWWQPSFWLALSAGFDFRIRQPNFGLSFGTENYGNIRCIVVPSLHACAYAAQHIVQRAVRRLQQQKASGEMHQLSASAFYPNTDKSLMQHIDVASILCFVLHKVQK